MSDAAVHVRRATAADEAGILELLAASLGWEVNDRYAAFFAWKHYENAFGPSAAWVAVVEDRVVGYRAFLRWELEEYGLVVPAVQAVDTATHPNFQGQGIFSRLTRGALEELADEGVACVFNTPNAQSGPGYVKMGWRLLGRPPAFVRPRASPASLARVARARRPAERWSQPCNAGVSAIEALADDAALTALLATSPRRRGLRTHRTPEFLRWRYGFEPLAYRAVSTGDSGEDGFVIFRLRRRGAATEAAVCDFLVRDDDPRLVASALRRLFAAVPADHAVVLGRTGLPRAGFVPAPRLGPTVAWRSLGRTAEPDLSTWSLTLGDLELF